MGYMLIPRFSLLTLFVGMTLLTGFFYLVARAVRGDHWALGVTLGLGSLILVFVVHAGLFLLAFVWDRLMQRIRPQASSQIEPPLPQAPSLATSGFED